MKLKIDKNSPVPIYHQIATELERKIQEREVSPGDWLPGSVEIANKLEINPITVNKAFSVLVEKGLIKRKKRAGTFVNNDVDFSMPSIGFFYHLEKEELMSQRAEVMQCLLSEKNYQLKIVPYQQGYFEQVDFYDEIKKRNLKGAVISGLRHCPYCMGALKKLEDIGFPHVRFGSYIFLDKLNSPIIRGNETQCMRGTMEYLWSLGHRKIGAVVYSKGDEISREFKNFYSEKGGYEERWQMGLGFKGSRRIWEEEFNGPQIARGYLEENNDITALVVSYAFPCIDFLKQAVIMGRNVPADLSLFCLHDMEFLEIVEPSISSMQLPMDEMVANAIDEIFNVMKNGLPPEEKVIALNYKLCKRESTEESLCTV